MVTYELLVYDLWETVYPGILFLEVFFELDLVVDVLYDKAVEGIHVAVCT